MPEKIHELQQQRNKLASDIRTLNDELSKDGRKWTPEDDAKWEAINKDYDGVMADLKAENSDREDRRQRAAAVAERMDLLGTHDDFADGHDLADPTDRTRPGRSVEIGDRRVPLETARACALSAWARHQYGLDPTDEEIETGKATGIQADRKRLSFGWMDNAPYRRLRNSMLAVHPRKHDQFINAPLTTTTPTTGGNLIPPQTLIQSLEVNMLAFGGMRQVADTISTTSGEEIGWPTADDTGNKGRIIPESTSADDNAGGGSPGDGGPNPAFGKVTWGAFKYTSDTILVPFELLEDSAFDLVPILGEMLGERIGRATNEHFTVGTGSGQPTGIVNGAALGVTAASATVIAPDEVYDLQHSVDPAYRPGARFMAHDSTALHLRKLKDTQNRYLWQDDFNSGVPDSLAGSPFTINQDMPTIASSAKSLLFGQLSKYKIRRVNSFRLYRLEERYRDKDQDGFVVFLREDGGLLSAGTPPVKFLQQA